MPARQRSDTLPLPLSSLPLFQRELRTSGGCLPSPYNRATLCRGSAAPSTVAGHRGLSRCVYVGTKPLHGPSRPARLFLSLHSIRTVGTSATCLSKCRRGLSPGFWTGRATPRSLIGALMGVRWGKIVRRPPQSAAISSTSNEAGGNLRADPATWRSRADRREVSWPRALSRRCHGRLSRCHGHRA